MARSRSRSTRGSKHYKIRLSKVPDNLKPWMRHLKTYTDKYDMNDYSLKDLMKMAKKTWKKSGSYKPCSSKSRKACKRASRKCSWNRNRKGSRKHKSYCSKKRTGRSRSRSRSRS